MDRVLLLWIEYTQYNTDYIGSLGCVLKTARSCMKILYINEWPCSKFSLCESKNLYTRKYVRMAEKNKMSVRKCWTSICNQTNSNFCKKKYKIIVHCKFLSIFAYKHRIELKCWIRIWTETPVRIGLTWKMKQKMGRNQSVLMPINVEDHVNCPRIFREFCFSYFSLLAG